MLSFKLPIFVFVTLHLSGTMSSLLSGASPNTEAVRELLKGRLPNVDYVVPQVTKEVRADVPAYVMNMYELFNSLSQDDMLEDDDNELTTYAVQPLHRKGDLVYQLNSDIPVEPNHAELVFIPGQLECQELGPIEMSIAICGDMKHCTRYHAITTESRIVAQQVYAILNINRLFKELAQWEGDVKRNQLTTISVNISKIATDAKPGSCNKLDTRPLLVLHCDSLTKTYEERMEETILAAAVKRQQDANNANTSRMKRAAFAEDDLCGRHRWRVSFKNMGWTHWIIQPEEYMASICGGDCAARESRITGHAYVRLLYKQKINTPTSDLIPGPYCAPTKMAPMSMLFMNSDRTITVKRMPDMIVEECACV